MLRTPSARFAAVGLAVLPVYVLGAVGAGECSSRCSGWPAWGRWPAGWRCTGRPGPRPGCSWAPACCSGRSATSPTPATTCGPRRSPFPSWADLLYAAGYPSMTVALLLVLRRSGVRDAVAWQDAGIWTLAASLLAWPWLLEPTATAEGTTLLARVVASAFPVLDLLLMLLLLRLVAGRERPLTFGLLALALAGYLVSDALYGLQSLAGTYESGSLVDLGWIASYFGIGAIALHPGMLSLTEPVEAPPRARSRLRWVGLAIAAMLAPGMLAAQHLFAEHVDVLVIAVAAAVMFVLTTLRGAAVVHELDRLTQRLRLREHELHRRATTDSLTGLANRSALHERLQADAASGRPTCVALLDLDEFKHVNDTRGHEAGDALLVEVASRLVAGLGPHDLVARLGGDEFAVVSPRSAVQLADHLAGCLPGLRGRRAAPRCRCAPASASRSTPVVRPTRTCRRRCCATPTSRCTPRRGRAGPARPSTGRRCRPTCCSASRSGASSSRPSPSTASSRGCQPVVDLATGAAAGLRGARALGHPARGHGAAGDVHPAAPRRPAWSSRSARRSCEEAARQAAAGRRDAAPASLELA